MSELVDRVRAMADDARAKEPQNVKFAYFRVTEPSGFVRVVLHSPRMTQAEAIARYQGCGVLCMSDEEGKAWRGER